MVAKRMQSRHCTHSSYLNIEVGFGSLLEWAHMWQILAKDASWTSRKLIFSNNVKLLSMQLELETTEIYQHDTTDSLIFLCNTSLHRTGLETIRSTDEKLLSFKLGKLILEPKSCLVRDRGVTSMSNRQLPSPECTAQRSCPFVVLVGWLSRWQTIFAGQTRKVMCTARNPNIKCTGCTKF